MRYVLALPLILAFAVPARSEGIAIAKAKAGAALRLAAIPEVCHDGECCLAKDKAAAILLTLPKDERATKPAPAPMPTPVVPAPLSGPISFDGGRTWTTSQCYWNGTAYVCPTKK